MKSQAAPKSLAHGCDAQEHGGIESKAAVDVGEAGHRWIGFDPADNLRAIESCVVMAAGARSAQCDIQSNECQNETRSRAVAENFLELAENELAFVNNPRHAEERQCQRCRRTNAQEQTPDFDDSDR